MDEYCGGGGSIRAGKALIPNVTMRTACFFYLIIGQLTGVAYLIFSGMPCTRSQYTHS